MGLKENLRQRRIQCGLTQPALANRIGVSVVAVGNWERGVNQPSVDRLIDLSRELQISIDELVGNEAQTSVSLYSDGEEVLIRKYRRLDRYGKKAVDTLIGIELERTSAARSRVGSETGKTIPLFSSPAAAGIAAPIEGDDYEMLRVGEHTPSQADYAVRISGDSMAPYIQDGEIVFVKKADHIRNGEVGIFCVNGAMYCKQYFLDEQENLHLLSTNPERSYASIHVDKNSDSTVALRGKVLMNRIPIAQET